MLRYFLIVLLDRCMFNRWHRHWVGSSLIPLISNYHPLCSLMFSPLQLTFVEPLVYTKHKCFTGRLVYSSQQPVRVGSILHSFYLWETETLRCYLICLSSQDKQWLSHHGEQPAWSTVYVPNPWLGCFPGGPCGRRKWEGNGSWCFLNSVKLLDLKFQGKLLLL